jgi:multisubunit Na+/H+ antiporter MnhB subunit
MAKAATMLRSFDISISNSQSLYYNTDEFLSLLAQLKDYQNLLLSEYKNLKSCPATQIGVTDKDVIWKFDKVLYEEYSDLFTAIGSILSNVIVMQAESALQSINQTQPYRKNMFNVLFNSFGTTLKTILNGIKNLEACEKQRLDNLSSNLQIIVMATVISSLVFFTFLSLILIYFNKNFQNLWSYLKSSIAKSVYEVKNLLTDRLIDFHFDIDFRETESEKDQSNKITDTNRYYIRYILRFSMLIVIALLFHLLCVLYFGGQIVEALAYKHSIISRFELEQL